MKRLGTFHSVTMVVQPLCFPFLICTWVLELSPVYDIYFSMFLDQLNDSSCKSWCLDKTAYSVFQTSETL